jgi:hypothetical protein
MSNVLSASPTITYNGVKFPVQVSFQDSTRCVRDSSGRHNKYLLTTYSIRCIIQSDDTYGEIYDSTTASTVTFANYISTYGFSEFIQALKVRLSASAGNLDITDHIAGDPLNLNTATDHDFAYGPFPEVIELTPLGGKQSVTSAVSLVWSVTVARYACLIKQGNVLEHNLSISWSIDASGLTTRTVSGSLEIGLFRSSPAAAFPIAPRGSQGVSADYFRDNIKVESMEHMGFQRVQQSFTESEDKRRLSYQIVDQELPSDNAYSPGIVTCRATYDVSNQNIGMLNWDCTLSMSVEVAKGYPRFFGWLAFINTLNVIHDANKRGAYRGNEKPIKLITHLSIQEDIFGRSMSFSVRWWLAMPLSSILSNAGFWEEHPNSTWAQWAASMAPVTHARGHANLSSTRTAGKIVNVCLGDGVIRIEPRDVQFNPYRNPLYLALICPKPKNSWLQWQNEFALGYESDIIDYTYLGPGNNTTNSQPTAPASSETEHTGLPPDAGEVSENTTVSRGTSAYEVTMKGYAVRIGYEIPAWSLTSYGGAKATMVGIPKWTQRRFDTNACGIYIATWNIKYRLDKKPVGSMVKVEEHDPSDFYAT